eukprot:Hpha_TRINITY_DN14377_c0_g2::TRINITY_DN14377_c0_g2_i1::g.86892::m.86892
MKAVLRCARLDGEAPGPCATVLRLEDVGALEGISLTVSLTLCEQDEEDEVLEGQGLCTAPETVVHKGVADIALCSAQQAFLSSPYIRIKVHAADLLVGEGESELSGPDGERIIELALVASADALEELPKAPVPAPAPARASEPAPPPAPAPAPAPATVPEPAPTPPPAPAAPAPPAPAPATPVPVAEEQAPEASESAPAPEPARE